MSILHIASWYPNPWDRMEGNFIRDQIQVFSQELPAETVVVQVRPSGRRWPWFKYTKLEGGARGYFLLIPNWPKRIIEWLSTFLLVIVLLKERAWRFDALHVHIAYPLLMHSKLWRWIVRKPIIISEHWSAYHFNFHLPESSKALARMRRPFQQGYPVLAVSKALLNDIRNFAETDDFMDFVVPNVVPLHGYRQETKLAYENGPVLFSVNRWAEIKNPMPMLQGLERAAANGYYFDFVVGGFGPMMDEMISFIESSELKGRTRRTGKMTKSEIAIQLSKSDGYLFSSNYETFSIACAEALGAGVPLVGPRIPVIANYAGPKGLLEVSARTPEDWQNAVQDFIEKWRRGCWDQAAIAQRAASQFSVEAISSSYIAAMQKIGLMSASAKPNGQ